MDDIAAQLFLQAVLILVNAFFAMTEIAVISLSPVKLKKLSEEGDKKSAPAFKALGGTGRLSFNDTDRYYAGWIFGQCVCGGRLFGLSDGMAV